MPGCCREAFDRLTEYSSLLLQHGDYSIHSTPREQLVAQTDAAEAAQLQAVMGVLSTFCTSTASDMSAQTDDVGNSIATFSGSAPMFVSYHAGPQAQGTLPGRNEAEASDGMDADTAAPSAADLTASSVTEEAATADTAEQAVPADPDEDIFGGAETQQQQLAGVCDSLGSNQDCGETLPSSVDVHQDAKCHRPAMSGPASRGVTPAHGIGSGFVYDDASGTWYNADSGYFYDATQGLYGDASSGKWYSYSDGMYQLVC